MGKKSFGTLFGVIDGTAEPWVRQLKRADKETKDRAASIEGQLGKLGGAIGKKFTLGDFGKDLLKGLGLGSGFALVNSAMDKLTDHYREQADIAKSIEESTARQLETTREIIAIRQSKDQKDASLDKQYKDLEAQLKLAKAQKYEQTYKGGLGLDSFSLVENKSLPRENTKEEVDEINKLTEALGKLGLTIDKSKYADQLVSVENALTEFFGQMDAISSNAIDSALTEFFKPIDQLSEGLYEKLDASAERMKSRLKTPQEHLNDSLDVASELFNRGLIDDQTFKRSHDAAARQFGEDADPFKSNDFKRWEKAAGDMRVDDLTRRGLGTGAKYDDVSKQTNSILSEILEVIRAAKASGFKPSYSD